MPLLLIITLYMGRRSIAEMPVFDFLVVLTLGSVVGADIADLRIEHLQTAIAIVLIALLQRVLSTWLVRSRRFVRLSTFEPTVVIYNGQFLEDNLRKIRYTVENLLNLLREKDVFDIRDVHLAIVESNGRLSVLKAPNKQTVTVGDMELPKPKAGLTYPVVVDGTVHSSVLAHLGVTETWLAAKLREQGVDDPAQVFFATVDEQQNLHITRKDAAHPPLPPIRL